MGQDWEQLAALLRDANRGQAAAYKRALTLLTPFLRGIIRRGLHRVGRGPDDSEDILQDTLLAIHLKRHTWNEAEPLRPWVCAIAQYKLVDFLRRRGNRNHVALDDVVDDLPAASGVDPARSIDQQRLLKALPERQRRIVEGIAIEGRTAREVAEALGMTEVNVRVTLHRALKSMGDAYRRGSA